MIFPKPNDVQTINMADAAVVLVSARNPGAGQVELTGRKLFVDAQSAGTENLTLPTVGPRTYGVDLDIVNIGGESILLKNPAGTTLCTILAGGMARAVCSMTAWAATVYADPA